MGAINGDDRLPKEQFGLPTAGWYSTGADGSAGVTAEMTAGGQIGSPVVSVPGGSSQVTGNMPQVEVLAGDTCGSSADAPVPAAGDPMSGLTLAEVTSTGAGQGSAAGPHHPNARG